MNTAAVAKGLLPEGIRVLLATAVAIGGTFGYLEMLGPDQLMKRANPTYLQALARPDPWRGDQGRANERSIEDLRIHHAKLAVDIAEMQLLGAGHTQRIEHLEEKEIPPPLFEAKVYEMAEDVHKLRDQVTELRVLVGGLVDK